MMTNNRFGQVPKSEDIAYMRDVSAALHAERHPSALWTVAACGLTVLIFLVWAALSHVDEVTKAQGRVIASDRDQVIQSLDPGAVAQIYVKEGDRVKKGAPLIRIDDARSGAGYREERSKMLALEAAVARLNAEVSGTDIKFPAEVAAEPDIVQKERELYVARKQALDQGLAEMKKNLSIIDREISITAPMVDKGVVSEVELLRLREQASGLRLQMTDRVSKYRAEANTDLTKFSADLAQAQQATAGREDAYKRATIVAPMDGIVKNIKVSTIGGVVAPGEEIMELVPDNDSLIIEAYVKPADVAFLRPNLPATVKVLAYDYSIYGGLEGVVSQISADTIQNDDKSRAISLSPNDRDQSFYRVVVKTKSSVLNQGKAPIRIFPGLTTTVDIKTGRKTVLSYLLKPVFKARDAFHER
ncbi:HlyD family efflux transporter periplasmic adaptor subunit [Paraburkholderia sediminicola]|uniref:HlyD family efflux transporter periplasmic adaptor subunit n=1 Tax=Paraburkholderia rhynchosiae TaxID=487049 RepID=A0ACC7NP21_9BURK